jgi:hypothetical protein
MTPLDKGTTHGSSCKEAASPQGTCQPFLLPCLLQGCFSPG